jgi:hypothetical protein
MDPNTDIERIFSIIEAVRQEVWRVAAGVEAAAAADRARDEALAREVAAVATSAAAVSTAVAVRGAIDDERSRAAVELRWEDRIWEVSEAVLMYCGTARAMAAMGMANYAFGDQGTFVGRLLSLIMAIILDFGVVLLVGVPRLGEVSWLGRLGGCWRRWWRPTRRGEAEERAGGAGGFWGWAVGRWWSRPSTPNVADQADSPV